MSHRFGGSVNREDVSGVQPLCNSAGGGARPASNLQDSRLWREWKGVDNRRQPRRQTWGMNSTIDAPGST